MKKVFLILSMVLFTVGSFASNNDAEIVLTDDFNSTEIISQEVVEDFDSCYQFKTILITVTDIFGSSEYEYTIITEIDCSSMNQE